MCNNSNSNCAYVKYVKKTRDRKRVIFGKYFNNTKLNYVKTAK